MDSSPRRSILAEMALRFVDQRETLATAGLGHVLGSSATARDALASWLVERGVAIPDGLGYRIEVVDPEQEGRPDVVGLLGESRHLILEGKFWASLTDSQPVGYLKSLGDGGCLLVVAPSLRFETVGAELVRRCVDAGLPVDDGASVIGGGLSRVADRWWLGVISWRSLLGRLQEKLLDAGEPALAADVEQLVSLSDLEDQDAFLPLASTDLSNPTPQRVYQYMQLVDAVCARGVEVGLLQRHNFRPAGPMGKYIRYIAAGHIQLAIFVDLQRWSRQRLTPLWVELAVLPGEALATLEAEIPTRVFYDGVKGRPVAPLMLLLHVEQDEVVRHLLAQLVELVGLASDCPPTVRVAVPPAIPSDSYGLGASVSGPG